VRRGLNVEWSGPVVFISTTMRVSCRSNVGAEGSMVICEGLVGDSSRWRSSEVAAGACSGLWLVAWHNIGDNGAVCGGFS
jgi:hypothetical protein